MGFHSEAKQACVYVVALPLLRFISFVCSFVYISVILVVIDVMYRFVSRSSLELIADKDFPPQLYVYIPVNVTTYTIVYVLYVADDLLYLIVNISRCAFVISHGSRYDYR